MHIYRTYNILMHQHVDANNWHYYHAHYWDYVSYIIRHTCYNFMHSYASHIVLTHYILLNRLIALEASYSILLLSHPHIKQRYKCTGLYMLGFVVINPNTPLMLQCASLANIESLASLLMEHTFNLQG